MTLIVRNFSKRYGGLAAVQDVSLEAAPSEVTAIIGPNGAGKTTLLNLISGVILSQSGRMELFGRDVTGATPHELAGFGLTRTYQSPQLFPDMTVLETVMVGAHLAGRTGVLSSVFNIVGTRREERRIEQRARLAIRRAGLTEDLLHRTAMDLAYGLQRRVEVARALATEAKVILLDEPAAGLNATEKSDISHLIHELAADGYVVVLVEHDMDMVMGISHRVIVMNMGQKIADGTPDQVQSDPRVIEAYLGSDDDDADYARTA